MRKLLIVVLLLVVALVAFDFLAPHTSARIGMNLERARNGLETRSMQMGEVEIAYLEGGPQGEGVESIVLVHGFGADKDNFTRAAGYLTDEYHVVIPDLPGFGDSSRLTDVSYDIDSQVVRLHSILEAMGLQRFHIGGSSMGGAIAATYAATYPNEVVSVWLLAPGGVAGAEDSKLIAEYKETGKSLLVARELGDFEKILELVMEKPPFIPYSGKRVLAERAVADHDLHLRIFKQLAEGMSINAAAATVQAPTLIVWGDRDRALDVSGAKILDDLMPNSRLIVMQGIGHLPMLEAPGESAADYQAFLDNL